MVFFMFCIAVIAIGLFSEINKYSTLYDERTKKERQKEINNRLKYEYEQYQLNEKKNDLRLKLGAVQSQLAIMRQLDTLHDYNAKDEKTLKERLRLEKQYNALWEKERKLKRELNNLKKALD